MSAPDRIAKTKGLLTSRCLSSRGSCVLLSLSLLLLLTEAGDGAEDGGPLARSAAALACLVLLRLFLLLLLGLSLVLGLVFSLGLGGLLWGSDGGSKDGLAESAVGLLVLLALGDSWGQLLGLGLLCLQGSNPAVALGGAGSLEGVLVTGNGEEEDGRALGLDIGDLRLGQVVSKGCTAYWSAQNIPG
jgi:hypothetical protein